MSVFSTYKRVRKSRGWIQRSLGLGTVCLDLLVPGLELGSSPRGRGVPHRLSLACPPLVKEKPNSF